MHVSTLRERAFDPLGTALRPFRNVTADTSGTYRRHFGNAPNLRIVRFREKGPQKPPRNFSNGFLLKSLLTRTEAFLAGESLRKAARDSTPAPRTPAIQGTAPLPGFQSGTGPAAFVARAALNHFLRTARVFDSTERLHPLRSQAEVSKFALRSSYSAFRPLPHLTPSSC